MIFLFPDKKSTFSCDFPFCLTTDYSFFKQPSQSIPQIWILKLFCFINKPLAQIEIKRLEAAKYIAEHVSKSSNI